MTAVVALLVSAGLCVAAVLAHAPTPVVPFIAVVCVGLPVFGTWDLPSAIGVLRAGRPRRDERAIARLRRALDELPEVSHPLDR
jgi:hypothetical protein